MRQASTRTFLTRLRASVGLSAFVLLVFALKIGAAAACAGHDFADLGLGSGSEHSMAMIEDQGGNGQSGDIAGDCDHSNHHASAIVPMVPQLTFSFSSHLSTAVSGLPPSASPDSQLRPPIA